MDQSGAEMRSYVVSAFFGGTASSFAHKTTQIEMFGTYCEAVDARLLDWTADVELPSHMKLLFDGCGVTNGIMGTLFASGLNSQVEEVIRVLSKLVGRGRVVLNALGLSRGGVACLLLAQAVQRHFGDILVEVNALVFDPVPGNTITSAKADLFSLTLARQGVDLSGVRCLRRVLGLYPHIPLPDHLLHAPLLPRYSEETWVEEEVILGCHQGAIWSWDLVAANEPQLRGLDRRLSFVRIHEFLKTCGTFFTFPGSVPTTSSVVRELGEFLQGGGFEPTQRFTHSYKGNVLICSRSNATYI